MKYIVDTDNMIVEPFNDDLFNLDFIVKIEDFTIHNYDDRIEVMVSELDRRKQPLMLWKFMYNQNKFLENHSKLYNNPVIRFIGIDSYLVYKKKLIKSGE